MLYSVDDLPCDVDGDGMISEHFIVAGQDTGIERLNPEWLFKVPGRIDRTGEPSWVYVPFGYLPDAVRDGLGPMQRWLPWLFKPGGRFSVSTRCRSSTTSPNSCARN